MKCSKCPTSDLLPARTSENDPAVDGYKCLKCDTLYRMNKSNHLIQVSFGEPKLTDVAPVQKKELPPVTDNKPHPERVTLAQLTSFSIPSIYDQYGLLTSEAKAEIRTRLKKGELPPKIVRELHCERWQVYKIRKRLKKEAALLPSSSYHRRDAVESSLLKAANQDRAALGKPPLSNRRTLTEKDKDVIRTKVAAGVATSVICKELNCKTWQVYYYGSPKNPRPTRVTRTREEVFSDKPNPSLVILIHRASNGFIVTDADDSISIHTNTASLLGHIKKWAGA